MPLNDRDRLSASRANARVVDLWFALCALKSVTSFMQSGAHPDDETSSMLAALRFRDGLSTSYACSTRGEGGQNVIGTETGAELGALRTAEMERACAILDMRMWWHSETADDPITDFGFSKSGTETMGKWGRDRTLSRFVHIVRHERPDILCPTFLDVPGQHGHHRAMTEAAHLVMQAAADPDFHDCDLPPWQISKLYLPAWGGGGGAYDDEVPPPSTTVIVPCKGVDPITGWSWAEIGQQSRMYHATQGMGRWVPPTGERDWPLHLAISTVGADTDAVTDNLLNTLTDLELSDAQTHTDAAIAAFPDRNGILEHATAALNTLAGARIDPQHHHRIEQKKKELSRVIRLASGLSARARAKTLLLRPGETSKTEIETRPADLGEGTVEIMVPEHWQKDGSTIGPNDSALPSDPYTDHWDPLLPRHPSLKITLVHGGCESTSFVPFEQSPSAAPDVSATLLPEKCFYNLAQPSATLSVHVTGITPVNAEPRLALPDGWEQSPSESGLTITPAVSIDEGLVSARLSLDGKDAATLHRIEYPHTDPRVTTPPAIWRCRIAHVDIPKARVGYLGAGNDRVGHWLHAMGVTVEALDDQLNDPGLLDNIETLVIGVFAFKNLPGLLERCADIHEWVRNGGTLVTLYHRPWDNWDPDSTPPAMIEIGQPSLRWRVTDETADVTHLMPDHPLLNTPNKITTADWDGWTKERGLYFAKSWDPKYQALLSMADPDEEPLTGALLCADIGKGRHSHVALGLHTQLENLTPGAFRLMANLVTPRR